MAEPENIELRLRWRKTWADHENDFVGIDRESGKQVGRFYLHDTGGIEDGRWRWFFASLGGFAATPREAAKAIEDNWFAAIEGKVLDEPGKRHVNAPEE